MPFAPGQSGNPSGRPKGKPWADAIRRALARRAQTGSGADLNALAERLIDSAAEGDMAALKELGDRLDGKPAQTIAGDPDAPLVGGTFVLPAVVTPEEWVKAAAEQLPRETVAERQ